MPDENRELEVRRIEKLHGLTNRVFGRQIERYEQLEMKVWRHFALLAFLLGTLTVGIPTFVRIARAASGWWAVAFVGTYGGMLVAGALALGALTAALRYERVKAEPLSEQILEDFRTRRYLDELISLSKGAVEAQDENGRVLEAKVAAAKRGYGWTVAALVFGIATIGLLLCIELQTSEALLL